MKILAIDHVGSAVLCFEDALKTGAAEPRRG